MVLAARDDKEGEAKEYYSNGARKANTSQRLENQQAKKLREGCKEIIGATAPLIHPQNPKPLAARSGSPMQPGGTKPRAATTEAVPKATGGTELGSEQKGVPPGRSSGEPDLAAETEQEPPGAGAFKSKSVQEREPAVNCSCYPTFWGSCIPIIPPKAIKETTK